MSDTTQQKPTPTTPAGWWPDVNQPGWDRYWNGWSWENATRRTPGAQPTVARSTFVKPKRSIWPWVAGGSAVGIFLIGAVVIFVIIIIAIIASAASGVSSEKVRLSDDKPAAVTEPEKKEPVKEKPKAEPVAPVAKVGSLANPWPVGDTVVIDRNGVERYTVTARMIDGDAFNLLYATNSYSAAAPPEGMKYVLMEYTVTGVDDIQPVSPGVELHSWNLADANGVLYEHTSVVTPGDNLITAPDLYVGQSFTGQVAHLVPNDSRPLFFSAFGGYLAL